MAQRPKEPNICPPDFYPTGGFLPIGMPKLCKKFQKITGTIACVQEMAGMSNKFLAKSEQLKIVECCRQECFICLSSRVRCERNGEGAKKV